MRFQNSQSFQVEHGRVRFDMEANGVGVHFAV